MHIGGSCFAALSDPAPLAKAADICGSLQSPSSPVQESPSSIEIADAHWRLLLRSAPPRDAKLLAAAHIAPTNHLASPVWPLPFFSVRGG